MLTDTLCHPAIGSVEGRVVGGLLQFRSIQYAHLDHAFAEPVMKVDYGSGVLVATEYGPQVISPPDACDFEFGLIQQSLPRPVYSISGTGGLHLTITRPIHVDESITLPVLVYVHGGGFAVGSSVWPQYDQARFVEISTTLNQPVISVSINYRLGAPGFLTSAGLRGAGIKANNGLRDQRIALLWVQKFISGFGGDPDNVTLAGQSAGAVAAMLHLQSEQRLFDQMICLSGTTLALGPLDLEAAERASAVATTSLGLGDLGTSGGIEKLLSLPEQRLWQGIPPEVPMLPVLDGDIIQQGRPTFDLLHRKGSGALGITGGWCRRVMFGSCALDASVISSLLSRRGSELVPFFNNCLRKASKSGDPPNADQVYEKYKLPADIDEATALKEILELLSDVAYLAPASAVAKLWSNQAFVYRLAVPNPWDGPFKSDATHILDIALLFQNFRDSLPQQQAAVGTKFAQDVVSFLNKKDPYPKFDARSDHAVYVYGLDATETSLCSFSQEGSIETMLARSRVMKEEGQVDIATLDVLLDVWHCLFN